MIPSKAPSDDSDNVKHKLMHAFWHACPSFERSLIIKIIENPDPLSNKSFIEAIKESCGQVRLCVAECILGLVTKTD